MFCGYGLVQSQPPRHNVEDEAHKALVKLIREGKLDIVRKVEIKKPPQEKPREAGLLSLDFQEADIRAVLRTLAVMGGINIVWGEDVKGTITVHLKNVTFQQALEIILKIKGLTYKVISRNTLRTMTPEVAAKEAEQIFTQTALFHFNYAQAADIQKILKMLQRAD